MSLLDLILNLTGLILWLKWRSVRFTPAVSPLASSLISTLRQAGPSRFRWVLLVALGLMLVLRGLFYWQVGPGLHWIPGINFGPITLAFRSDLAGRIFLFSLLSFVLTLGIFYLSLLLLSLVNTKLPTGDSQHKWVRLHLGWVERLPGFIQILLPFLMVFLFWMALNPILLRMEILPPAKSFQHLLGQGALLGLGVYLLWKYLIVSFLLLNLINSYVYVGNFPFWSYVNATARSLLRPVSWLPLRFGQVDGSALVAIALIFGIARLAELGLTWAYQRLLF